MTTSGHPEQRTEPSSAADPLQALTQDLRRLVREELASAKGELVATGRRGARGGLLLGGGAACGILAGGASAVVVLRILDRFLPPIPASVVATGLWGAGAAVLARTGVAELRRAGSLVPRRTAESVRADAEAVRSALAER